MMNSKLRTLFLSLAFFGVSEAFSAEELEIYIPPKSAENSDMHTEGNSLARCLATGLKEDCEASEKHQNSDESGSDSSVEIVLETFIIDLDDTPKKSKVLVGNTEEKEPVNTKSVQAAGVVIKFDFDSHKLRVDQSGKLSQIALALADEINTGAKFAVIGHTDAKGSDQYNCTLSLKRAATISSALLTMGSGAQLFPLGVGEALLKEPSNPTSEVNRRVSFLKLDENAELTLGAFVSLCHSK
jgi:OmpA-OmpF porin, OOP family